VNGIRRVCRKSSKLNTIKLNGLASCYMGEGIRKSKKLMLASFMPQNFKEAFLPMLGELAQDFRIIVTCVNYCPPSGFISYLNDLKKSGLIEEFLILPDYAKTYKSICFLQNEVRKLQQYRFDVWLNMGEMHLDERFIAKCVLPESCLRIVLCHQPTFLLKNEALVRQLLSGDRDILSIRNTIKNITSTNSIGNVWPHYIKKIKEAGSIFKIVEKSSKHLFSYLRKLYYDLKDNIYYRVLVSYFITGKTFRKGPYDDLTQIGSGQTHAIVFCDVMDAKAHKALFKTPDFYVAQHPAYGFCRCKNGNQKLNAILSPLSGFIGMNVISEECLSLFYRDFKIAMDQTGAKSIHLRMHPNERGRWYQALQNYLSARGMDVVIVDCERPIHGVICDYLGMAGSSSCALRDGRAGCQHAFIIGFESVSNFSGTNSRFRFGNSEGIGWIRGDGSYDPSIFKGDFYHPSFRKRVPVLLKELAGCFSS